MLPPKTISVGITESGTDVYVETIVVSEKRVTHIAKDDINFDAKLGQFLRIASRQNFDTNYNPTAG